MDDGPGGVPGRLRRLTLLVNPSSGRGRAGRLLAGVRDRLALALPHTLVDVVRTIDYSHAQRVAASVVGSARRGDALAVMGGDGMAAIGHNACGGTWVPLGVIPAGTGNDFCRGVGLPTKVGPAVEAIAGGLTERIDLMRVSGDILDGEPSRLVGSVMSTGFDERVNWRTNRLPVDLGAPSYAYSVFTELRSFHPLRYRIEIDGAARELDAMLVAVANAGIFGGGVRICPDADVHDGRLDVTIVHPVPRGVLFRLFPRLFTGSFVTHPAVETLRASSVLVDGDGLYAMADGENLGRPPLACHAEPGAVTIFVPRGRAAPASAHVGAG